MGDRDEDRANVKRKGRQEKRIFKKVKESLELQCPEAEKPGEAELSLHRSRTHRVRTQTQRTAMPQEKGEGEMDS